MPSANLHLGFGGDLADGDCQGVHLVLGDSLPIQGMPLQVFRQQHVVVDYVKLRHAHPREADGDLAAGRTKSNDADGVGAQVCELRSAGICSCHL